MLCNRSVLVMYLLCIIYIMGCDAVSQNCEIELKYFLFRFNRPRTVILIFIMNFHLFSHIFSKLVSFNLKKKVLKINYFEN